MYPSRRRLDGSPLPEDRWQKNAKSHTGYACLRASNALRKPEIMATNTFHRCSRDGPNILAKIELEAVQRGGVFLRRVARRAGASPG